MIKPIVRDIFFLGQKAERAVKADIDVGRDLLDTLQANRDRCGEYDRRAEGRHRRSYGRG